MRKMISVLLALAMILSLGVGAFAEGESKAAQIMGAELKLLASQFDTLKQADVDYNGMKPYYYAVTDLDHNGRIELLAYCLLDPAVTSSIAKGWEINAAGTGFEPLTLAQGLPDLLTDTAQTIYNPDTGAWYYLSRETLVIPALPDLQHEITCAFTLTNGRLDNGVLAQAEHVMENGLVRSRYCVGEPGDENFRDIDEATYLNYVNIVFPNMQKTNTAFDWFKAEEATSVTRFAESYGTFRGEKGESRELVSSSTPPAAKFVSITKNPTSENRKSGETAYFVADAANYGTLSWSFVSPSGQQYSVQQFRDIFPGSSVNGEYGTTLSIGNVTTAMSGWGAFCSFNGSGQNVRSNTAYLYVQNSDAPSKSELDSFYAAMAYLYGAWTCPLCGGLTYGDYCAHCGFDPEYYYALYYLNSYDNVYDAVGLTEEEALALALLSMDDEDWALLAALAEYGDDAVYDYDPTEIWDYSYYDWNDYNDYDDWYEKSYNTMLICPHCGNASYDGSYCYKCGYPYLEAVSAYGYSDDYDWDDWDWYFY